jgi:hypothetical protein
MLENWATLDYGFVGVSAGELMGIGGSIAFLSNAYTYSIDPIVAAWVSNTIAAGGTISISTQNAFDTFVKGCKSNGIWAKMSSGIIMPIASQGWVGAMVPLIAPVNATFTPTLLTASDYSFTGGIDPGAGNLDPKRIVTNVNAQSLFVPESAQVSVYRPVYRIGRDSVASTVEGADVRDRLQFHANWENGETDFDAFDYDQGSGRIKASGLTPIGLMTGTRLSGFLNIYKNGISQTSLTSSFSPIPNAIINLLGCFDSGFSFYSRSTSAYLYLGQALTATEELSHYNLVQSLQASLGRSV